MKNSNIFKTLPLLLGLFISIYLNAQDAVLSNINEEFSLATVKLDGNDLFRVRGVSSLPAQERAKAIGNRIKNLASNYSIPSESVKSVEHEDYVSIISGDVLILTLYPPDAQLEDVDLKILSRSITDKIKASITKYRHERSKPVLMRNAIKAIIATVILVIVLLSLLWLFKKINLALQNRIKKRIESVENISFNLIKSNQIWRLFHVLMDTLKTILVISIIVFFIEYVLGLFPWTSAFSKYTLDLIIDPIQKFGIALVNYFPKLIFLVFIYFVTKYVLKLIKLLFYGIEEGNITIKNFNAEWAGSTFKIVRVFVIAFAIIISYPYIPGSDSVAFKGVSVFVGLLFSLGSSSFIGNIIAGYSMIYRGAFKKGDLIEVDDMLGFVEEQKLMVTRLRSSKNEEFVIPNSVLLNSKIINYKTNSEKQGLIIHTQVGIGYETPWRQVDAMLKLAADRTEGILKDPPPFVLKKSLADYAVNYEINGYCRDVSRIKRIYSLLHQNILDVFNENNVQIMTPSYVSDPEIPKVVPKDQWDTPLASDT